MKDIKINTLLKDDCNLLYRVCEVMTGGVIVEKYPNVGNFSGEYMSFESLENEEWEDLGLLTKKT